jgi:hypothetical protein
MLQLPRISSHLICHLLLSLRMCHLLLLMSTPLWLIPLQSSLLDIVTAFVGPPDYYSPSAFTTTTLSELASYRDAILHPKW